MRPLHFTRSLEDRTELDAIEGFHTVIAASGMRETGRIHHRLKRWLWSEHATRLMDGSQAEDAPGQVLHDGTSSQRFQGKEFDARARIRLIDLSSSHADRPALQAGITARRPVRQAGSCA